MNQIFEVLGVGPVTVGEPDTITFVFAYVNTPEEIPVSVGSGVPVVDALCGLVYSFARSYRRQRRSRGGRPGDDAGV